MSDDKHEPTRTQQGPRDPSWAGPDQALPEYVDGYRVLRLIGQGGMGMVFEAEQQEPRRRVALKVLRGSAHTDDLQVRLFRREVETLARLRHPNIAAIYGSGRLPDGRPYFAMELVEGPTLDAYLNGRPSPANRDELVHRLALMRKIVEAVHYAHQRGVIHRDLKPSNIVVTEGFSVKSAASAVLPLPEVKILDFGLARITDGDAAESLMSDAGTIRGTLPYMSPEQASGRVEEIDVRSDVYALGVILYELLAGGRPYDVRRAALAEAVRVICDEPPRPLRQTPSGIHRVDADLQTIVFKALAKEADRRYGSAAAMAEDVERYMTSQPIMAHPPSAAYQLRKLIERHRAVVAALALVLVVIAGASIVSTALFLRARTEAAKSEQVAGFLGDMLTGVGPSVARGRDTVMLREILDRTAKRVTDELSGQPEVAAGIHQVLGTTYLQLGELDVAESQLDAALATHRGLHSGPHAATAADLTGLGTLKWNGGKLDEAEAIYIEALAMRRALHPGPDESLAGALSDLGNVLVDAGRYDEAEPYLREALDMKRAVHGAEHELIAVGLNSLANLLHHRGKLDEAEPLYRDALAMHRKTLGEDHPDISTDLTNLGWLLLNKGDFDAAEASMREGVEMNRKLYGGDHPRVASGLDSLGSVLKRKGDWAGAEARYREVLEMNVRLHGEGTAPVADALNSLAIVIGERQGPEAALPMWREALAIHRKTLEPGHPNISTDLSNLAYALVGMGQDVEAEALYKEALGFEIPRRGEQHPTVLLMQNNLARLYSSRGDLDAAEALFRKVLAGRRQLLGEKNDSVAVTMTDLAKVLRERGLDVESEKQLTESLVILDATLGPKHPATIVTHSLHGRALCDLGRAVEAEPELRAARDSLAAIYGPSHERTLGVIVSLARAVAARGDAREAEELFRTVVDAAPKAVSGGTRADARIHYGAFLAQAGRFPAAESQLLEAEEFFRESRGGSARSRAAAVEGLVSLYESWATASPGSGKSREATKWRAISGGA